MWIAGAHRDDGKRFIVRTDEKLTAFLELESAILSHIRETKRPETFNKSWRKSRERVREGQG
jgi:hypothetical protein